MQGYSEQDMHPSYE